MAACATPCLGLSHLKQCSTFWPREWDRAGPWMEPHMPGLCHEAQHCPLPDPTGSGPWGPAPPLLPNAPGLGPRGQASALMLGLSPGGPVLTHPAPVHWDCASGAQCHHLSAPCTGIGTWGLVLLPPSPVYWDWAPNPASRARGFPHVWKSGSRE